MNQKNMHQIFEHYIEKFSYLNNDQHSEYFKWQVCNKFKTLMDEALYNSDDFANALNEVRKCTSIIIDSGYIQPFGGLVDFAKKEPDEVRKMFKDLYTADGGDIHVQMEIIKDFFDRSYKLVDKYRQGSFRYKQNSHSVSSYLFLYSPDNHYMYKATESKVMADCIGFYDDWGSGDNIKLDIYYRMCDEILEEIKSNPELLATDESRFDERLHLKPGELHKDTQKHILLFDIIYCCHVYDLFDGISFTHPKSKEKKLYLENKAKAERLLETYNKSLIAEKKLNQAYDYLLSILMPGAIVTHRPYGEGVVVSSDRKYIKIDFKDKGIKTLSLPVVIANRVVRCDIDGFDNKVSEYQNLLVATDSIQKAVERNRKELKPFEEYLE
jgi:hypothetical protein